MRLTSTRPGVTGTSTVAVRVKNFTYDMTLTTKVYGGRIGTLKTIKVRRTWFLSYESYDDNDERCTPVIVNTRKVHLSLCRNVVRTDSIRDIETLFVKGMNNIYILETRVMVVRSSVSVAVRVLRD